MAKPEMEAAIAKHGLKIVATFVPFSQSRHAAPREKGAKPWRSLNWTVRLTKPATGALSGHDVVILKTDYSAGEGHCPGAKARPPSSWDAKPQEFRRRAVDFEIENGREAQWVSLAFTARGGKPIEPDTADVIHSLISDADVLNYNSFEDWALSLGYDEDSRKAEAIYRSCLELALQLRNGLPAEAFADLVAASEDY